MNGALVAWGLTEVTLSFVVFCADSVGEEERGLSERIARALLWMVTLTRWFTHRNVTKLGRFGAVVWFLVTTGWLLSLEYDRAEAYFFILAEATMAFVVYCVDALSADLQNKPFRRILRSVFWVVPVARYLADDDSVALIAASVTVWGLLTTGWLLGLIHDRIATPLGAM
ncbi:MAG TPA: hypothetical protein VFK43_19375 [Acidimicrobiales bacterium]|nr:hypothetical protein [Acidimicrobiales bacterium]